MEEGSWGSRGHVRRLYPPLSCLDSNERVRPNTLTRKLVNTLSNDVISKSILDVVKFQPLQLGRRSQPFSHQDWLFEINYDGFRALALPRIGLKCAAFGLWVFLTAKAIRSVALHQ